jgi:hypothetical protein
MPRVRCAKLLVAASGRGSQGIRPRGTTSSERGEEPMKQEVQPQGDRTEPVKLVRWIVDQLDSDLSARQTFLVELDEQLRGVIAGTASSADVLRFVDSWVVSLRLESDDGWLLQIKQTNEVAAEGGMGDPVTADELRSRVKRAG